MKLCFEFLTVFRQIAGLESVCLRLAERPGRCPTVSDALQALEDSVGLKGYRILHAGRLAAGVLVFRRTSTGALERIRDPEDQGILEGERLVLSVAMEGG